MAFRFRVASNSDWPPDKNMIPLTAGGTRLFKRFSVYLATSSGLDFFDESAPGVTMEGFNKIPSNNTLLSAKYLKVSAHTA